MLNHKKLLLPLFLISCVLSSAQEGVPQFIDNGELIKPLVVLVYPQKMHKQVAGGVYKIHYSRQYNSHYLLVSHMGKCISYIAATANDCINKNKNIDKQRIYLLLIDEEATNRYYDSLDKKVFAATRYVQYLNTDTSVPMNLDDLLNNFNTAYTWQIQIDNIEQKQQKINIKENKMNAGFVMGMNLQGRFSSDTAYLPGSFMKYGFLINKYLNRQFSIQASFTGSFKVPNQQKLQSELQSQIKPGGSGSQKIKIEIATHFLFQANLQLNYYLPVKNTNLKPYLAAGTSVASFRSAYKKVNKYISISSLQNGNREALGIDPDEFSFFSATIINPFISAGFEYKLTEKATFVFYKDLLFQVNNSVNGVKVGNGINSVSVSAGIQFNLAKKGKPYYNYVQLK